MRRLGWVPFTAYLAPLLFLLVPIKLRKHIKAEEMYFGYRVTEGCVMADETLGSPQAASVPHYHRLIGPLPYLISLEIYRWVLR